MEKLDVSFYGEWITVQLDDGSIRNCDLFPSNMIHVAKFYVDDEKILL